MTLLLPIKPKKISSDFFQSWLLVPLFLLSLGWFSNAIAADDFSAIKAAGSNHETVVAKPIAFQEIGAKATTDYHGDAIGIRATADGAELHTAFQKLAGTVTCEGLQLASTTEKGGGLHLVAGSIGRDKKSKVLPVTGNITVGEKIVSFARPGLTEEYSVSVDGVRQDFVLADRPLGNGELRVELALTGAKAEGSDGGVRLILNDSGRALAYNRLRVSDATGRELTAKLEVLSSDRIAVRIDDRSATYPVRIDPTFSDANWVGLNSVVPGVNSTVHAVAVDSAGVLYIGGDFTLAHSVNVNYIVQWNGTAWTPLGAGMDSRVFALAVDGMGNVYAGGDFVHAGGLSVNHIAKWNGSAWSALGAGMDSSVYALALDGSGNLFAGGNFSNADSLSANYIAKWNGSAWSALGAGMDSTVNALVVDTSGNLYAGGDFANADGTSANFVAKWNGSAWSALGSGMDETVYALAVDGYGNLYAGGSFANAGGSSANCIAEWNGSAWSALGTGMDSTVKALVVDASGNLYAGGTFKNAGGSSASCIAVWNGTAWSALGTGLDFKASALALDASGNLYAGGHFKMVDASSNSNFTNIAKWNNSSWSGLDNGGINAQITAIALDSSGNLYAGGSFTLAGGSRANYIAQWNGSIWSTLNGGMNDIVNALVVDASGNLYAAGNFTMAGGSSANHIAKWNGIAWSALGVGMDSNVYALALDQSGNLYAGGDFANAGGTSANHIALWNGNSWSALGAGLDSTVFALTVDGSGNLYAGGSFANAGGSSANNIAQWNGSAWSALGTGMDSIVFTLAVDGSGNLYAGGDFANAGGTSANHIAKWDGSAWSPLGAGMDEKVYALTLDGSGNLYAGGNFANAGGTNASYIAQWNGSAWLPLGSGMDSIVSTLVVDSSNHLYAGGFFKFAGTAYSPYIAEASLAGPLPTVTTSTPTNINTSSAFLSGLVNPNGLSASALFVWGTSPTLAGATSSSVTVIGSGTSPFAVITTLNGLTPGTTYYFRLDGTNTNGNQTGGIISFTTQSAPVVTSGSTTGTIGTSFNYPIVATGSPTSYSALTLPPGLACDPTTGLISGTPTGTGTFSVALSAANSAGTGTGTLSVVVPCDYTYTTSNNAITITGYTGNGGDVVTPSTVNGLPVVNLQVGDFSGNKNLTSITIPSSVTSLVLFTANPVTSFASINVASDNPVYASLDGVLFDKTFTTLIQYPPAKSGSSYTIPNTVTTIGDFAFMGNINLTSITFPSSVTTIKSYAFYDSTNLALAIFNGNAPTMTGIGWFGLTAPGFTVEYSNGSTGFTSPTWDGYTSQVLGTVDPSVGVPTSKIIFHSHQGWRMPISSDHP